ncbi:MAG: ArsR family transcriptional regulator [Clostridiaceae bacterium]|jgi:predicted transcriptional regulator|nr:ArsR family transcriptional regulator [Clostridiaceae bacterium]
MKIKISEKHLPVFEALASGVRLKIINLLSQRSMNIKELAQNLSLSSAILTMHIRKLEDAGIIKSERVKINGAIHKICSLDMDLIEIEFPKNKDSDLKTYEFILPVGHYTDFNVTPTCGLATTEKIIGYFDDPRYFWDPERVNAKILWFTKGYIEYKVPNHLLSDQTLKFIEISMELGSEAPGVNSNWPSDISFFLNGVNIGHWTSPGDFGSTKGNFTPDWWSLSVGQYGLLKIIKIDDTGSYIDGEKMSEVTLSQLNLREQLWSLRIAVLEDALHQGGVTLFGSGFGNYDQDIVFRLYYV